MSRKNVLFSYSVSGATPKSMATSFTSDVTIIDFHDTLSYQTVVSTTSSAGSFSFQGSNDYDVRLGTGNFTDLLACGVVAAASDTIMLNATSVAFKAVRLAYTATTPGDGTCVITLTAKTKGA